MKKWTSNVPEWKMTFNNIALSALRTNEANFGY